MRHMSTPGSWLGPTLISAMAFGLVFITGISAPGNDLYDSANDDNQAKE
jgi:hypothetical protein